MGSTVGMHGPPTGVELSAKSAICVYVPGNSIGNEILHEKDADRLITPASIIKLLTAVTAVRVAGARGLPSSFELTVLPSDSVEGSGRNVQGGDRFSLQDGLANLLLASSNVSANAIARTFGAILLRDETKLAADPVDRFVCEMNSVGISLRMTASRFLNPHGLPEGGQRSTARELALLVRECLNHRQITETWGLDKYAMSIRGENAREMVVESIFQTSSINEVPNFSIPHYQGGKSGTLWPSAFNLAAVSEVNGGLIISVTIGSPTAAERYSDYLAMVEIGTSRTRLDGALRNDRSSP